MNNIMTYVYTLVFFTIFVVILEMILPQGNTKKYVRLITGVILTYVLISPVFNIFSNASEIKENVFADLEKMNFTYEGKNKEYNQAVYVQMLFEKAMDNDIKKKVGNCGYVVDEVKIEYDINENNELGAITYIEFRIIGKSDSAKDKNSDYSVQKVNIEIGDMNNNENEKFELSEDDKNNILELLSNSYQMSKENIHIL